MGSGDVKYDFYNLRFHSHPSDNTQWEVATPSGGGGIPRRPGSRRIIPNGKWRHRGLSSAGRTENDGRGRIIPNGKWRPVNEPYESGIRPIPSRIIPNGKWRRENPIFVSNLQAKRRKIPNGKWRRLHYDPRPEAGVKQSENTQWEVATYTAT